MCGVLLALVACGVACGRELPTLAEVLGDFEDEVGLEYESCDGGLVDCGGSPAGGSEFVAARGCLLDAWDECRPTRFSYTLAESSDLFRLRHVYVVPDGDACGLVAFEHVLPTSAEQKHIVERLDCEDLIIGGGVCGGIELRGCSRAARVEFAPEQYNE